MNNAHPHPPRKYRKRVVSIVGALCLAFILLIGNFFHSLIEIEEISPQPYVTIVSNNISSKSKVLLLKGEFQAFMLEPNQKNLQRLHMKARVYRASILQDLKSKRSVDVHKQYGDVVALSQIIAQVEVMARLIQQVKLDNQLSLVVAEKEIEETYQLLNEYLADFIAKVQKHQMKFNQFKESSYKEQYLNLGLILLCAIIMIGIVSWMYIHQSKLSHALQEHTEHLEKARTMAEQSAVAKARFLANMSHEMRTPLNAIIGLSQKEHYQSSDEQAKNFASLINSSGEHLLKLINSILDLSKIEQGSIQLDKEKFFCSELIESSKTMFIEANKPSVELYFTNQLEENYQFVADKTKLVQIITNLTHNAIKFTHQGHVEVQLSFEPDTSHLMIAVSDTGIGMSAEQLELVFNEFTQADDSISRQYGGTGLGLSICKSLVDLMQGSIDVESQPQQGTRFVVTLPVTVLDSAPIVIYGVEDKKVRVVSSDPFAERTIRGELQRIGLHDDASDKVVLFLSDNESSLDDSIVKTHLSSGIVLCDVKANPDCDGVTKLSKPYDLFSLLLAIEALDNLGADERTLTPIAADSPLRALVVEDMQVNQFVVEKMLSLLKVEVEMVNNGQECLERLKESEFDVIFMDIQMPIMDGMETLKHIKAQRLAPNSTIIALTANTFESDVASYLEAGFEDVLSKPFQLEWMKEMLNKYCHRRG